MSQNASLQEMCCPLVGDTQTQSARAVTLQGEVTLTVSKDRIPRTDPETFRPPSSPCVLFFVLSLTPPSLRCGLVLFFFWQTPCSSPAGELPALIRAPQRVCAVELGSSWTLPSPQVLHERGEVLQRFYTLQFLTQAALISPQHPE